MSDIMRFGSILWKSTRWGHMVPEDLHDRLLWDDYAALDEVATRLLTYRKVEPILEFVKNHRWRNFKLIRYYLMESMRTRSGARAMIGSNEWNEFWCSID